MNWNEANQGYLIASLKAVQEELELYQAGLGKGKARKPSAAAQSAKRIASTQLEAYTDHLSTPAALDTLATIFDLSSFEKKLLLLCAGVELDAEFGDLIASLQAGGAQAHPSFSLAMAAFSEAHWSALAPGSALRFWQLIELDNRSLITKSSLKIDEQILHYLTGVYYLNERLTGLLKQLPIPVELVSSQAELVEQIIRTYSTSSYSTELPIIHLSGTAKTDKVNVAAAVCASLGLELYTLPIYAIPAHAKDFADLVRIWNREAALNGRALLLEVDTLDMSDRSRTELILRFIDNVRGVLILNSRDRLPELQRPKMEFEVLKPTQGEQLMLWQRYLGDKRASMKTQLEAVVAHFNLSPQTIQSSSQEVLASRTGKKEKPAILAKSIWQSCCVHTRPKVEELAQRIVSEVSWDDLVLPEAQMQILHEIVMQVRHRNQVYQDWGFQVKGSRGMGISALFTGESGTGKTLASEVLANELNLDLYRIDLSQVVNKYIGETEKNLKKIFDAAEEGGAILLFDEADALFGKRSEVKDSHDRYSNIEVSYLLQRMEAYGGLAILTSNLRGAIDKAFMRRIRFVVPFPFPDTTHRARIWQRSFPAKTPIKDLDMNKLARLNIPGGNIKNIVLNAAFIAAEAGQPVQMGHLLRAARSEYNKLDKTLTNSEIGRWQ